MSCNVSDLLRPQLDGSGMDLFDAHAVRDAWRNRREPKGRTPCHFYLHVPFCKQRCFYCCYYSVASSGGNEVDRYLDSSRRAMAFFAPAFARRPFQTLYIGGGTPSILTPGQLRTLLSNLLENYEFDADGQKTVECSPFSLTREKLDVLRRFGINRISMGVQSLNRATLSSENRGYQEPSVVERAVRLIREAGDFYLNLDLLLGMRADEGKSFMNSFGHVMRLDPDKLTVNIIYPQRGYLDKYYSGQPALFRAHLFEKFGAVPKAIGATDLGRLRFTKRDPTLGDDAWSFHRTPPRFRRAGFPHGYQDFSSDPVSVFGLGPSARSRAAGALIYKQEERLDAPFDPRRSAYRGRRLSSRDEMVKYLVIRICDGARISPERFRDAFGVRIETAFPKEVAVLRQEGRLTSSGNRLAFRLRSAEDRDRGASLFAAPPGLTLETAAGRWRLNVEPRRDDVAYFAETGALGLRLAADGDPWPKQRSQRIARIAAALFRKSARGAPTSAISDVERAYAALLADVASRLGATLRCNR
ncbi:MAG: radical SAM protein [Elusimicrobiota bacterium]